MQRSRREFIKNALATSAIAPLSLHVSGCSSLDQWLMGESREDSERVIIIGAGLAGLTAAYQLKKSRMPFQIFEGSQRIGGRVWTLENFNGAAQHVELGGEQIEVEHVALQNLAKELKVSFQDFSSKEPFSWFEKGRLQNSKEDKKDFLALIKLFQKVQQEAYGNSPQTLNFQNRDQFPKAVLLDQMSVAELLDRLQPQMKNTMRAFLEQVVRSEWGVEPQSLSALHLVHWMKDPNRLQNRKFMKISGGNSVLVQALFDRVGGVIPEKFIRFGHQLTEIEPTETGWSLFFRSPKGKIEIKSRKVICTLPPPILRGIQGWEKILPNEAHRKLLKDFNLATHGKVVASFHDRFWKNDAILSNGGSWISDLPTMQISEAGDHAIKIAASRGLLQSQLGGSLGENCGLHSVDQMLKDLGKMNNESSSAYENLSHVHNWKRHPWSQGSKVFLKPGQFQQFDLSLKTGSGFLLAGDAYDLASLGTMNGAIQSAIDAAGALVKS